MTRLTTKQLREDVDGTLKRVVNDRERVVLRRNGKDVAVIVPIDEALIEYLEDLEDLEDAHAILKEIEKEGTIPWETVKKNLGL